MVDLADYELKDRSQVLSPCLLVYPEIIQSNLAESIRIAGSTERVRLHVKTHKTPQIVEMALAAGITKHKCATLAEAKMLSECGVPDVLIAYPQVGPNLPRLTEIVAGAAATRFSTVVDNHLSLESLAAKFQRQNRTIDVLVDIDTGMHRTGISPGEDAVALYRRVHQAQSLRAAGLHVYDGQNHQADLGERRAAVKSLMTPVRRLVRQLKHSGLDVPKLVCGGTPTFPVFAQLDSSEEGASVECSPGTCVLSDYNYGTDYSDMSGIRPAAVLLTRVVSKHAGDRLTVDLGYKAVASDPPAGKRCHFLGLPDATEIAHSEEHLIVQTTAASRLNVGDVLYALPAHICPTVALHSHLQVVEAGQVVEAWPVRARDRLY